MRLRGLVVSLLLFSAGCGDSPAPAPTPMLSLACPARIETSSIDGRPVTVPITLPLAAGGSAPVAVTCNQPTQFPIGSTTVGCTATDARQRTASCSFVVAVKGPPRLRHTTFLAFGDSITAGTKSDPVTLRLVPAAYAYTVLLQGRLASRYTLQTPTVWNEGVGGEFTSDGLLRLRPLLQQFRPEVLLLMEGTNDLLDRPDTPRRRYRDRQPPADDCDRQVAERPGRAGDRARPSAPTVCGTAAPSPRSSRRSTIASARWLHPRVSSWSTCTPV